MIAVGKADECIEAEEILRHEEISGLPEKRLLSSGYKRKDLGKFEGSPSKKTRNLPKDVGVHKPMRKKKGKRRR
eukprot:983304-Prorocentrum_minimum.AAC.1